MALVLDRHKEIVTPRLNQAAITRVKAVSVSTSSNPLSIYIDPNTAQTKSSILSPPIFVRHEFSIMMVHLPKGQVVSVSCC